jgi:hypothetical protein
VSEEDESSEWSDEGDWYIRMIIDHYEERLSAKDQRIHDLEEDLDYYKYELARAPW